MKLVGVSVMGALLVTLTLLPSARADLVLEEDIGASPQAQARDQAEVYKAADREQSREVMRASENLEVANTVEGRQEVQAAQQETSSFSQAELMRRERQRHEIRNEDLLQVRLEQLRLRDEKRRTSKLLGQDVQDEETAPMFESRSARAQNTAIQTEQVSAPSADRPGEYQDRVTNSRSATETQVQGVSSVSGAGELNDSEKNQTSFAISPRVGVSDYLGGALPFQTNSRFTAGVGLLMNASDTFAIEAGYSHGEIGLMLPSSNPWAMQMSLYSMNREPLTMRQNTFDAGARIYLMTSESKFRPFIGLGAAYMNSYVNYDPSVIASMSQMGGGMLATDYQINSFLGTLSGGADFRVSKSISIGAMFRYHFVLNATQNTQGMNMYGFYPQFNPAFADPSKAYAGLSLARQAFYSLTAGVTLGF